MFIRPFKRDDNNQVKDLITLILNSEFSTEKNAYSEDDLKDIDKTYGGKREAFFVCEDQKKIVGTVGIKEDTHGIALLRRIFVHPDYRQKGYGSRLIDTAIEFCKILHYKEVVFRSTDKMKQAINLCLNKGFIETEKDNFGHIQILIFKLKL